MKTAKLHFVEDIFIDLYNSFARTNRLTSIVDQEAFKSLFYVCSGSQSLTQKQSEFIVRLIKKHQDHWPQDYSEALETPTFKKPFRQLETKHAWIEQIQGQLMVLLKYPYSLKGEFERTFLPTESIWIPEKSARGVKFYSETVEKAYRFAVKHKFTIDQRLSESVKFIKREEKATPTPYCAIKKGKVVLENASTTATSYFNKKRSNNIKADLLLAKSMGYPLKKQNDPEEFSLFTTLASASTNAFWVNSYSKLFDLIKHSVLPILIIVDRSSLPVDWIQRFIESAKLHQIDYSVKVLTDSSSAADLVEYANNTNYNGNKCNNKIFIAVHSLQSWFVEQEPVGMVVTNMINIPTNTLTREFLNAHPVSVYFSTVKPTVKGAEIASL